MFNIRLCCQDQLFKYLNNSTTNNYKKVEHVKDILKDIQYEFVNHPREYHKPVINSNK